MKQEILVAVVGLTSLWIAACDASGSLSTATAPTAMTMPLAPGQGPIQASGDAPAAAAIAGGNGLELLSANVNSQLNELRRFVAPFHNFDKAVAAGYSVPVGCVSHPTRGGMGYHYTQQRDLINDGRVELLEPEFLVYAPKANGGVKFAALDYFVPYNTWTSSEPPSLLGRAFEREDDFQAYVIHIWLFWHNPAGMFENYNPDVPLCP